MKLEDGKEYHVIVGDGNKLAGFIRKIRIRLAGVDFEAAIGFSKRLGIGFNVLGQKDIFDKFIICFPF